MKEQIRDFHSNHTQQRVCVCYHTTHTHTSAAARRITTSVFGYEKGNKVESVSWKKKERKAH